MKQWIMTGVAVAGLTGIMLSSTARVNAQDAGAKAKAKKTELLTTAQENGIAMIQDDSAVYIYDAKLKKIFVISKTSKQSFDGGEMKPVTVAIDVSTLK